MTIEEKVLSFYQDTIHKDVVIDLIKEACQIQRMQCWKKYVLYTAGAESILGDKEYQKTIWDKIKNAPEPEWEH